MCRCVDALYCGLCHILQLELCCFALGGGAGIKDAPSQKKKGKAPAEAEEEEGETFYDAMKKEMGGRLARTRAALDALDDEQRLIMEGHRPGAYLRLSFRGMLQAQQA